MKLKSKQIAIIILLFFGIFNISIIDQVKIKAATKEEIESELTRLKKEVEENKTNIDQYVQKMKETENLITTLNQEIETISNQKIENERTKINLEENLKIVIQNSQNQTYNNSFIELFFGQKSQDQLLTKTSSVSQINEYTNEAVEKVKDIQTKLDKQEKEINEKVEEQSKLTNTLNVAIEDLSKLTKEKEDTIVTIGQNNKCILNPNTPECKPKEEPIFNNNANQSSNLPPSTQAPTAPPSVVVPDQQVPNTDSNQPENNAFVRPSGILTQSFGCASWGASYPSGLGCKNLHNGLDFDNGHRSAVRASRFGTVIEASYNGGWGNNVIIKHEYNNETWYTQYAHLNGFAVTKGQYVETGAILGYQGNTGYSFGSHLHFSLYRYNMNYSSAVNPIPYF